MLQMKSLRNSWNRVSDTYPWHFMGYLLLAMLSLAFAIRLLGIRITGSTSNSWRRNLKPLFSVGGWTGVDSLIRNIGYILVPLSVLNFIGTAPFGGYGLAMTVMWTLIIPVLAITEGTNVIVGNNFGEKRIAEIVYAGM